MNFKKLGSSVFAAVMLVCAAGVTWAQVPLSQHVVLIIDENHSLDEVIPNMPWTVAQGYENGYAANYQSDNGGSLLDYLWLASGSCESAANCTLPPGTHDFNCNGNDCYYPGTSTSDPITDNNIFRLLNNVGISWKVYAQSYSAAGGTPTTPDNNNGTFYYRRHNGAAWYSDILSNVDGSASKIVDLSELETDVANGALPRFTIIVPDGNHDAHDCPVGMTTCTEEQQLGAADAFLNGALDQILSTPDFQPGGTGLILITFDECGDGTDQGCGASVYTALIGPQVAPHTISSIPYKHENALRTILDSLGVTTYPGATASADDMSDFFTIDGSAPEVVIGWPAGGASLSSPVSIEASAFPSSGHQISGWQVYVDSVSAYSAGTMSAIHPRIAMSTGKHTVVLRAWDNSGAYASQTFSLTVSPLKPTVTVSTPGTGATVGSPVNIQASASPTAGQTIGGWWIYVDGLGAYKAGATNNINAKVAMAPGTHQLVVRVWETSTAYGDQTLSLTVNSKPALAVTAPVSSSNVVAPINIQASAVPSSGRSISKWAVYVDNALAYKGGATESINAKVNASAGMHTVLIVVWDSTNTSAERQMSVDVQPVAVNISTPLNAAAVNSPVHLQATAYSPHQIVGWHIYVDSVESFTQTTGNAISADSPMAPGTHAVVIRAWDSTGAYGDQTISVTVP
jgi:hypothetical protein